MFRSVSNYNHPPGCVTRPKKWFWSSISLTFYTHKRICEHVTWKRHWVIGDNFFLHGCVTFQNKTWWHMNFLAHTTNTTIVCSWNMNVCAVCSQSMLYQYFSSSKSWPSRLLQCLTVLLPSFGCICDLVERFHDDFELMTLLLLKLLEFILNLS